MQASPALSAQAYPFPYTVLRVSAQWAEASTAGGQGHSGWRAPCPVMVLSAPVWSWGRQTYPELVRVWDKEIFSHPHI